MKAKKTRNNHRLITIVMVILLLMASGLSGCNDISDPSNSTSSSPINTTTTQESNRNNSSIQSTTTTPTETPEYTTKQKYMAFRDGYIEGLEDNEVNITNTSFDLQNDTLFIVYVMKDPQSDEYTGQERENITLGYLYGAEYYLDENQTGVGKSWIPKQINVTAVTPEGERYETAYTTFERAKEMIDGEITAKRYLLEYYGTIEPGPANPEYEG